MQNTVVPGEKSTDGKETSPIQATPTATPSGQGQSGIVQSSPDKNSTTGVQDFSPKETTPTATPATTETPTPAIPEGYKGFRQSLNERGVTDNRIGWNTNTGAITIDGYDVFVPTVNVDGTTYGSAKDIDYVTGKAYELAGNPLVAVRDTAVAKGYGNIVDWDDKNKQATIGGNIVPYLYNSNGTVYATQRDVDDAIAKYEKDNGITGGKKIKEDYDKEWMPMLKDVLNQLANREQFKYDPDTDDIYSDLQEKYKDNIEHAYRRVLNDNNSSVSGANSNVTAMAMAAQNEQIQNLNHELREREKEMYDRHTDETDNLYKLLEAAGVVSDSDFNKDYTIDRDQVKDTQYSNEREDQREQQEFDNYVTESMLGPEITRAYLANEGIVLDNEGKVLDNEGKEIANNQTRKDNAFQDASSRGFFAKEDEEALPWLAEFRNEDGTYSIDPLAPYIDSIYRSAKAQAVADMEAKQGNYNY